jgi:hypothetical protein
VPTLQHAIFRAAIVAWLVLLSVAHGGEPVSKPKPPTRNELFSWIMTLKGVTENGWEEPVMTADSVQYTSFQHAQWEGNAVTVLERVEFLRPQAAGSSRTIKSLLARTQYDCKQWMSRRLSETAYSENNMEGKSYPSRPQVEWQVIVPGTVGDRAATAACDRTLHHPMSKEGATK